MDCTTDIDHCGNCTANGDCTSCDNDDNADANANFGARKLSPDKKSCIDCPAVF